MRLVPRGLVACLVVLLVGALSPGVANASGGSSSQLGRHGDRGRLLGVERVASYPTAATGNLSVPRRAGPLATVAYLHGTSVSFYDAPSNPNIAGALSEAGESFDGPPSSAVFAGDGLIYVAPDYLGLGDSAVPRHRYFHAATEASSAVDLLAASGNALARLRVRRGDELFSFGFSQGGHAALVLKPSFLRAVLGDRDHPLRVRLRQNAVDRWRPDAPIRVYHSPDDEEVAFGDMLVSVDRLRRRGAEVTVRPVPGDHVTSWVRAMPRAAAYFRKLS